MAFEKFKEFMGLNDDDELTEEEIEEEKQKMREEEKEAPTFKPFSIRTKENDEDESKDKVEYTPLSQKTQPQTSFTSTNTFKLVIIEPKGFEECPKLVDSLKGRRPVIINLEKVETETAKKIFDFLSGATYALNGNVQKVANNIFIFAPHSVDISLNEGRSFEFQNAKSWKDR